jgi:hypothetical protein
MILANAITTVVTDARFQQAVPANPHCAMINAKVVNPDFNGRMAIEIIFDFTPVGQTNNDLVARLFFDPANNSFSIHDILRPFS